MRAELKNFSTKEICCPCCGWLQMENNDYTHWVNLQAFRNWLCKKYGRDIRLVVTSGYRCEKHNKAVGGVKNSQHTKGMASDIYSPDLDIEKLYNDAREFGVFSTIIFYSKSLFIHLDSRKGRHLKSWKWYK